MYEKPENFKEMLRKVLIHRSLNMPKDSDINTLLSCGSRVRIPSGSQNNKGAEVQIITHFNTPRDSWSDAPKMSKNNV